MNHHQWAPTPPMGWNSWDCYGASVTEQEVRANAAFMAEYLKPFGWEYVVVDIQWYEPTAQSNIYHDYAPLVMDSYGRLQPAENRFPSAQGGKGFRPLAQYIHSLGLKLGIHILRGIPRQAVTQNTPILGTEYRAADIANKESICSWNTDMYGINPTKPGASAYYNSIIDLYAQWGVDYLKVDDIARPYHKGEVELIRRAIDRCGRPIVLSLSPGPVPLSEADHLIAHANLWRMTDDLWDTWPQLLDMFNRCEQWAPYAGKGHWPDADMLPLGYIGIRSHGGPRMTHLTKEEQQTMLALWCMFRSPLMFGGDLTMSDSWGLSLLTNRDILEIPRYSWGNRQVFRDERSVVWTARGPEETYYLAQFNISETHHEIQTSLKDILEEAPSSPTLWGVKELFTQQSGTLSQRHLCSTVPPHGVRLYRLRKEDRLLEESSP
ncbi:MAG: glycoside hydrolase family 27 protein [Treponemataceae bacterium]|nr:glycoside hydrolase family 27 protein [Treponemataceae bacterium]